MSARRDPRSRRRSPRRGESAGRALGASSSSAPMPYGRWRARLRRPARREVGDPRRGQLVETRLESGADRGRGDRLEPLAPVGIGEDDRTELLPIERTVGVHDAAAEVRHDLLPGRLLRLDHVTGEPVGVDDLAAELPEQLRDRAFPRRDAAGEPDEQEGRRAAHTSAQSPPVFTSTTTGTFSGRADAMISRASASTAPTSSGGASKRSSSWTCSSIRARSLRATSAACTRTIAILIMSLAVPWTGAFIAMRSAALRATRLPLARSGR